MSNLQPLNNSGQFQPGNPYRWQPGDTPNPGGNYKHTPHADAAYARLGSLSLEQLKAYEPKNTVEGAIRRSLIAANEAQDWQEANAALKQLILCLDGSPLKRQQVEVNVNVEQKREILVKGYVMVFEAKSREQAIAEIEAIYSASTEQEREQAVRAAIEADEVAFDAIRERAEALVLGQS